MTPVGESLRRERLKRNLELEEISHDLKISTRFLQAIENDQYDKLPGGVFAKSFVRQYARLLGLNEEDLADQVQQMLGPAPEVPQFAEKTRTATVPPIQVPRVDEWETVGDKRFRWSGWLSAAVFVAVMLVCSAVYAWIQRPKSAVTAQTVPPTQSAVQNPSQNPTQSAAQSPTQAAPQTAPPATPPAPSATPPAPSAMATAPPASSPAQPAGAPAQALEQKPPEAKPTPALASVTSPNPAATVHVEITADEAVWVLARADGKYVFSSTMEPHTARNVEGVKEVTLRLGNAGGVTISLNGKPIGPAGPKGQVRTIQFTSGGFQIVPAKPASAPLDPLDRL
jgi:cytoskeleton protein RodZ